MKRIKRLVHKICWKLFGYAISSLGQISPILATKLLYRVCLKRRLNLKNPQTMTEKMQYLKLFEYSNNDTVRMCVDKYAVRNYVKESGCEEILNPLLFCYDDPKDIQWEQLPKKCVIKCNHGCGTNIICEDVSKINRKETIKTLKKWLKKEYGREFVELVYKGIERKIIVEEYIETADGAPPRDYKIFCSYGEPKLIYIVSGGHGADECLDYYTVDWEWIPVKNGSLPNAGPVHKKPDKLNEMLEYARILSKPFPMVRVDLYSEFNNIIFGELTFLATGGMAVLQPGEYDLRFGKMFPLKK